MTLRVVVLRFALVAARSSLALAKAFNVVTEQRAPSRIAIAFFVLETAAATALVVRPRSIAAAIGSVALAAVLVAGNASPLANWLQLEKKCGCLGPFDLSRQWTFAIAAWILLLAWCHLVTSRVGATSEAAGRMANFEKGAHPRRSSS